MGRFEDTPIILVDSTLQTQGSKVLLQRKSDNFQIDLPLKVESYVQALHQGTTLKDLLVHQINVHRQAPRFQLLFDLIDKLIELGFINQPGSLKEQMGDLRSELRWNRSDLQGGSIIWEFDPKVRQAAPSLNAGGLVAVVSLLLFGFFAPLFFNWEASSGFLQINAEYSKSLLLVYVLSSLLLSGQTLVLAFCTLIAHGHLPKTHIRSGWLGTYLQLKEPLKVHSFSDLMQQVASVAVVFLVIPLIEIFRGGIGATSDFIVVGWLLGLLAFSPFSESLMTRIIRFGFNAIKSERWEDLRPTLIPTVYFVATAIWLYLVYLVLSKAGQPMVQGISAVIDSHEKPGGLIAATMGLIFFGFFIMLVGDGFNFLSLSQGHWTRRLWFWKAPSAEPSLDESDNNLEILLKVAPFKFMEDEVVINVAKHSRREVYNSRTTLCHQGRRENDMFILLRGQVDIFKLRRLNRWQKVVSLEAGSVFGEAGFFLNALRTATVIATEEVEVLRIIQPKDKSLRVDPELYSTLKDRIWLMQTLVSTETWKGLPSEAAEMFLNIGTIQSVEPNKLVIKEGEYPNGFYVMIQGKVRASKGGQFLRDMERGDVFGEIALMMNSLRTASVTTVEHTKLLYVPQDKFWEVLCQNMGFGMYLEKVARSRLNFEPKS